MGVFTYTAFLFRPAVGPEYCGKEDAIMEETAISKTCKRMPDDPIYRAYKRLNRAIKDQKEIMDETVELYHTLFVRSLHVQKDMQSALGRLIEAAPDLADE